MPFFRRLLSVVEALPPIAWWTTGIILLSVSHFRVFRKERQLRAIVEDEVTRPLNVEMAVRGPSDVMTGGTVWVVRVHRVRVVNKSTRYRVGLTFFLEIEMNGSLCKAVEAEHANKESDFMPVPITLGAGGADLYEGTLIFHVPKEAPNPPVTRHMVLRAHEVATGQRYALELRS